MKKPIIPDFDDPQWWWEGLPYVALRDLKNEYADKEAIMAELSEDCTCAHPQPIADSEEMHIICARCRRPISQKIQYHCELYEFSRQDEPCINQCDGCRIFESKHWPNVYK